MTVDELKTLLDSGKTPIVVDVREAFELEIASFPFPVLHIPMGQLARRLAELPKDQPIVCACRSGHRSEHAAHFLMNKGYPLAENLEGGILAWSARIDPKVTRY
ncbi:MAG: sulfurtransferase [Acidobacteria bacterium]|nr:sulfurtransferase [Acidobacteriota bacterium]MCK6682943.1 sulfurtransferase [Thermoanaerobaculia bacterium]